MEVSENMQSKSSRKGAGRSIGLGVIILVLVAVGAYAYYYQPSAQTPTKTETLNVGIKTVMENGAEHHLLDPATITVQKGDHIVLIVTNKDQSDTHGLGIPDLGLDTGPLGPGQTSKLEFNADTAGTFKIRCSVPGCAPDHAQMIGQLIVTQ